MRGGPRRAGGVNAPARGRAEQNNQPTMIVSHPRHVVTKFSTCKTALLQKPLYFKDYVEEPIISIMLVSKACPDAKINYKHTGSMARAAGSQLKIYDLRDARDPRRRSG